MTQEALLVMNWEVTPATVPRHLDWQAADTGAFLKTELFPVVFNVTPT